jgi:Fe2+ transport system protein FeoA
MVYEVIDVPQPVNCENCNPCLRIRLMELGFITGQKIELGKKRLGLYSVNILTDNGDVAQTIALREEELERICLKELL